MKSILHHKYEDIIGIDNLLQAWQEFLRGKRNKPDVQIFQFSLMDNILQLHKDLKNKTYKHGGYQQFKINDPKPRTIHKASVRDRLLHRAVYRILYPRFDKIFISDSFSCRNNKGTHKALNRFREFCHIVSKNNTKTCWILKCDIRKFFASVDQGVLVEIIRRFRLSHDDQRKNEDEIIGLLAEVIFSFKPNGLPLGNLTSQLFANIYLNELDQFLKHKLKIKYYIRYADDFVILSESKDYLGCLILIINDFLQNKLKLTLHPDKVFIKTLSSGVDFLGWVNFPDHRVIRAKTKKRMFIGIKKNSGEETLNSFLGLLKHGNTKLLQIEILEKL
jgi:retron-type reverse transcriptase